MKIQPVPNGIFMKKNLSLLLFAVLLTVACRNKNSHGMVSTLAGSGVMGSADGKGAEASFSYLMGLTSDAAGNVYVADSHNNLIRKIGPDGRVTTLAGSGTAGSADGKGAAASFFNPGGVAADKSGNVYVADTHNSLIRKISPDGTVTTLAGRWTPGAKVRRDGTSVFDNPGSLAVDESGNVFVADWLHDQVCKVSPDGKVCTIAGDGNPGSKDGAGTSASFYLPGGIAVDVKGNLYVSDTYNNLIRKIDPNGMVTTIAGKIRKGSANGKGAAASFFHPAGIAVDKTGNIYVADAGNNLIRKISPDGLVTTFAGCGSRGSTNGDAKAASFCRPMGVAVDAAGNVYVADYQNNLVRKIIN
jgi:sugar lactone lactonase YvrE